MILRPFGALILNLGSDCKYGVVALGIKCNLSV